MANRPRNQVPPGLFNFSGSRMNLGALPTGVAATNAVVVGKSPVVVDAADPGMGRHNLRSPHRVESAQEAKRLARQELLKGFEIS